ncbi:sodium channel protein Nach-like [Topomyia yanbarensis]|uniref:sodium channel protein Nach-like n=1 Tax=Topomyia yanbarensis TaxID=2498891 RepID=UPI00273B5A49|nr:sodium channel protein Nach-like [Topomyia yanbarensis]
MDRKPTKNNGATSNQKRKPIKAGRGPKTKKSKSQTQTLRLLKSSLIYQTKEFFENSTLHGVRYIAEEGRPILEKLMWFCFVSTGAVAAIVIIFSLWEKFQTNPTITGLDTDFHNQEVIFPTVMVCPLEPYEEKVLHEMAFIVLANYENGSEHYEPFLKTLTRLSYGVMNEAFLSKANLSSNKALSDLRVIVYKLAIPCNAVFGYCRYKDEPISCCLFFKPVYSEHGFCYSFNSRYIIQNMNEERNTEVNYLYETDKKWGLSFAPLRQSYVFVHSHNEISGWDFRPQVQWDLNFAIDFLISMKQTYTTEDARQLSIGQRKCIFPDEVKLKYYQDEYTFSGCMKECRIRKCLKFCRCVPPFYAPAPDLLPYCNITQLACLAVYTANITSISGCQHCELGCQNTVYDIEKYSKVMSTDNTKEPVVTIEYLTWPIIRYKREVLFGWVDLLVSFGGIAGLFLGFSLLSGVEIVYFFTMRACCMIYKNRDELIAIEQEKLKRPQSRYNLRMKPDWRRPPEDVMPQQPLSEGMTTLKRKNVMTVGLMETNFQPVKFPVDGGISSRHLERYERLKTMIRPDIFRPVQVDPYSERIKPLDRNVVRTKDGLFYNGYLP